MMRILLLLLVFLGSFSVPGITLGMADQPHETAPLEALLQPFCMDTGGSLSDADRQRPLRDVARFYREFGFRPVWTASAADLVELEPILTTLTKGSGTDSIPSAAARLATLFSDGWQSRPALPAPDTLPIDLQRDLLITRKILAEAHRRVHGYVDPTVLDGQWQAQRRSDTRDIPVELAQAIKGDRMDAFIRSLHPDNQAYRALNATLKRYERLRQAGGWPLIPPGPTMRPGDRGQRVECLVHHLGLTGDLAIPIPTADPGDRYTGIVEAAVRRFQQRHGLHADGVAGAKTLAALNVPVAERIEQLRVNMERLRWLPDNFGDRYVVVNIPGFDLRVVEEGATRLHLRTIVGRKRRPTPILSGTMTYLEFNPYWNIPRKIARKDILPKVIDDPEYLNRQGIRIFQGWDARAPELNPQSIDWANVSPRDFPYRLRQDPSPHNALGQVKFMFPNHQSVYIHDTPSKGLFRKERRPFSSGCVRVASPLELAGQLLREQGWDDQRLGTVIADGERKVVVLKAAMPVHIVYFTAWVDETGAVQFREDIYGRDRHLSAALYRAVTPQIVCTNDAALRRPLLAGCSTVSDTLDAAVSAIPQPMAPAAGI